MVVSHDVRLRLCDPNKQRLPLIREQLRNKVPNPWFALTKKELNRIRKPFESYDKELLAEGYPESSEHLQRLLAVQNESGERDSALIDDRKLLIHTMNCFRQLENCERDGSSTTAAIENLARLAQKMTEKSIGIACEMFQLILDKMNKLSDPPESSKVELQYTFGKYLVSIKNYEKANEMLNEVLKWSEEHNSGDLTERIGKVYYDSLYNQCLNSQSSDKELAIQLAEMSKDVALKINDIRATTKSYTQRGNILISMENYEEAITAFQLAASELKKMPDLNLKVEILYKLSTCYFTVKDYQSCLLSLGALGRLATIYDKVEYQAHFGRIEGNVKLLMGENLAAQKNFRKSIEIYDEIGLHEYATSCRFLEAVAKCEHLIKPWIDVLIGGERARSFEERFEFNKFKSLIFNWKLKRELFCEMNVE